MMHILNMIEQMKEIALYIKERFPILSVMLFSLLILSSIDLYIFGKFNLNIYFYIGTILMVLFLLRVRITDDIKDFKYDSDFHKDRALQREEISIKQLKIVLVVVLLAELILQFFLPSFAIYLYFGLLAYSFLMYKDFFSNNLSKKAFFLYILLHQIIFSFYIYYYMCILNERIINLNIKDFFVIIFLFLTMYIYEVSRKMNHRFDMNNKKTNDTYAYRWGEKNVIILLFSFIFLQLICLLAFFKSINVFLIMYFLITISGIFSKKIREKEAYYIFIIIFSLLTFISYYLI